MKIVCSYYACLEKHQSKFFFIFQWFFLDGFFSSITITSWKIERRKNIIPCPVYFEAGNRRKIYILSIHSYSIMTRHAFKTLSNILLFSSGEMKRFLFYFYVIVSPFLYVITLGIRIDKRVFDKCISWYCIVFNILFPSLLKKTNMSQAYFY